MRSAASWTSYFSNLLTKVEKPHGDEAPLLSVFLAGLVVAVRAMIWCLPGINRLWREYGAFRKRA
jgi:hypothetical protein